MRVLIATGLYPPDVGGPATYSKLLFERLPDYGFDVAVESFGSVRHLPFGVRHTLYFFRLMRAARGADVVFAQDPVSVGLPAALAAWLLRRRFVLKVVGDYAWEQGVQRFGVRHKLDTFARRKRGYPLPVQIMKRIQRTVALHAVRVVVPSDYLRKVVASWGVPREHVVVIRNGIASIDIPAHRNVLRGMVKASGTLIMSAGRFVPWKGFDGLIRMLSELEGAMPTAKLMLAGNGPEQKRLERLAERLGVSDRVIFLGPLSKDVLSRYVKISDIFVLNSSYEGLSHQLLEVMAVGTPVIATSVGGNPEVIEHEKSGLLVKQGDVKELAHAVRRIAQDTGLKGRLVRGAKRRVRDFSEERMLDATVHFLRSVM